MGDPAPRLEGINLRLEWENWADLLLDFRTNLRDLWSAVF